MYKAHTLTPIAFEFGSGTGVDKFRGLQEFGPKEKLAESRPVFGFVFPNEYKDYANRLYLALKNGIGYFRGVERAFRFELSKDSVFPITGFSIAQSKSHDHAARDYADAILKWNEQGGKNPDLYFILHPRTPGWETETPYYKTKAALLQRGILSQSVTADLIKDESVFSWSAANIALAAFVKLGGIPWLIEGSEEEKDLIIGVGRVGHFDPQSRISSQCLGYTACYSARGRFKFLALADVATGREEYLMSLQKVIRESLARARDLGTYVSSLTLHLPKELSHEESECIAFAASEQVKETSLQTSVVKVTDENMFFAVDTGVDNGVPRRGTVIQVEDAVYILCTEGREERQSWRSRPPSILRVAPQTPILTTAHESEMLRHVNELSQVNWRAFNARSRPISILYGELIARILSHVPSEMLKKLHSEEAKTTLETKMWFI